MKDYNDIKSGMIVYAANDEIFWDENLDSPNPDGMITKYTKMKVISHDEEFLRLEILEGQYEGKRHAILWWGEGNAKPEDYLTQEEYESINGSFEVNDYNYDEVINELGNALAGVRKQKFYALIKYFKRIKSTERRDKNGKEIFEGNTVLYKGDEYEVIINIFNGKFVLDNDMGQIGLEDVYFNCEVIR